MIRTEIELGKIIQRNQWKRASYAVATKIYWSTKSEERGLSRKHIIESMRATLQRLQLPYVDIVIIYKSDSMCPMEGMQWAITYMVPPYIYILVLYNIRRVYQCYPFAEVVRAMTYVIQQGWAMYWGTSRWSHVEVRPYRLYWLSSRPFYSTMKSHDFLFADYGSLFKLPAIQLHSAHRRTGRIPHVLSREM